MRFFPTVDEDFEYFRGLGYTGSLNDMHYQALGDLGYTGALNDRIRAYMLDTFGSYHEALRDLRNGTSIFSLFNYSVLNLQPPFVADFGAEFYRKTRLNSTFSDSITHSAASNATMVDSDGLLKWRPHNLLKYSEQFDNAAWLKSNVTVTANAAAAPDGTVTADRIVGTGTWLIYQSPGNLQGHTISVWAKSNTGSNQTFRFITNSSQTSADLTATTEWQLFEFEQATTGSASGWGLTRNLAGGSADILVWGAHLYRSDLGGMVNNPDRGDSYVPTTSSAVYLPRRGHHVYNGDTWVNKGLLHESEARTNLVTYSNDFTDASWANQFSTDIASATTGPDGLISATELTEGVSTASHNIYWLGSAVAANWTASVYIKEKTAGRYLQVRPYGIGTGIAWATFDPSDGSVYQSGGTNLLSATSESVGNGWYRVAITCSSALIDAGDGIQFVLTDGTLGEAANYTGDGTSGIYIYGAQIEAGSTPSSYIPTSGATVTRAAETLTVPAANLPWPSPVVIGEELVTNGTFDTDTSGWSVFGGSLASVSGQLVLTEDEVQGYSNAYQAITTEAGKVYAITVSLISVNGPPKTQLWVGTSQGNASMLNLNPISTGVDQTFYFTASGTSAVIQLVHNNGAGTGDNTVWDNISVKEINPLSVSIQMQGEMTYAASTSFYAVTPVRWRTDGNNYIDINVDTLLPSLTGQFKARQNYLGTIDEVKSSGTAYSPGVNVPFNIASRHGSTFINGAVDGTALTANTTPVALPDLSATDLQLGYDYMGTIKLFRIWANDLTDAGIAEASAPSTVPSLSLTFDGASTSFTDTGMTV